MASRSRAWTELCVALLRVWVGLDLVFAHGLPKVSDPTAFLESPAVQRLPLATLAGWFALLAEFVGGILLALGLFTRPAAACVLAVLLGAAFVVHGADPWRTRELALTFAVVLGLLLAHGPGEPSLDGFLARRRRSKSPW